MILDKESIMDKRKKYQDFQKQSILSYSDMNIEWNKSLEHMYKKVRKFVH
jgi:hypothetical protein